MSEQGFNYYRTDNTGYEIMYGVGMIALVVLLATALYWHSENSKDKLAQDILDIRNEDFTCNQLENRLSKTPNSYELLQTELVDKLQSQNCDFKENPTIKTFEDRCKQRYTMECRIYDLEHPKESKPLVKSRR